jgi:hypothetical protein
MELPKFDRLSGLPRLSQAITGITAGCRVITVLQTIPWFPAAAAKITPCFAP